MTIGPIDYLGAMPQQDFVRNVGSGLQLGLGIRQVQQQAAQQQRAAQMAQQYQSDLSAAMSAPTPQAFAVLAAKYPEQREAFKQSWEQLDAAQRKSQGEAALQASFALESGNPDAAKQVLQDRITALENSGLDSAHEKLILGAVDSHPNQVRSQLLQWAAYTQDPEKFAENYGKIGAERRADELHGDVVRKGVADADAAQADAQTKAITAKYADSKALADLEAKRWDIRKIASDIEFQNQSARIAAMNAAYNKEGNELKREELRIKIDDALTARDTKLRERVSVAENGAAAIDNALNTIARIKASRGTREVVGSVEGNDYYPNQIAAAANMLNPFTSSGDDRADSIALIDTLGSQAFLTQLEKLRGTGPVTNIEGEKATKALQNLSRKQSEKQFGANLDEAERQLLKLRGAVEKSTGVPLRAPDVPAAPQSSTPGVPEGWTVTVKGN